MRTILSFLREKHGNVAVTFALALVPLAGTAGVAIDYTRATSAHSRMQSATDAAALTAVTVGAPAAADRTAAANNVFNGSKPNGLSSPTLQVSASSKEAVVVASATIEMSISKLLQLDKVSLSTRSKAVKVFEGPAPCVFALNKTANPGIEISGNAMFLGKSCALQSNSSATGAITIGGSSKVKADGYCAVGTVTSSGTLSPAPKDHCDELPDPYEKLAVVLSPA